MIKGCIYILQSLKNKRYYIGSTINIKKRFFEHEQGKVLATRYLRPLKIIFLQNFDNIKDARRTEYKLKKYKSREIIEKIVNDKEIRFVK